jgi:hypothetical protein
MAATHILFFVVFILAVGIVTVAESATCWYDGISCNGAYSVCCNDINPGHCCPTGKYCCSSVMNFGCCPIGYICGLTYCTRLARHGIGAAEVPKTQADASA